MPGNYLNFLILIQCQHLCIYFIRYSYVLIAIVVFVFYNRGGCPRQQTKLGTVRQTGTGERRWSWVESWACSVVEEDWQKGDRGQKDPLLLHSQSEIQGIWFYQLRTAWGIVLAAVKSLFPKLIPSITQELALVRDHSLKTVWIQPSFSGEWESLKVWAQGCTVPTGCSTRQLSLTCLIYCYGCNLNVQSTTPTNFCTQASNQDLQ